MKRIFFITGTDTGVGKTILTVLLARYLRESGVNAAALKPVCSGGREDARALRAAMDLALPLNEINPWHFRAPIAPLLAARQEDGTVRRAQVTAHLRGMQTRFDVLLVEGAGGLLSPLGQDFNSRDLIRALRATPLVVAPNRLGIVNQLLLTLEALPASCRRKAKLVLMTPPRRDAATAGNAALLAGFFDARRILVVPWLGRNVSVETALKFPQVRRTLRALTA